MAVQTYKVTTPFKWATKEYAVGDLIELRLRSHLRHPALAGKVVPFGIDSARAREVKSEATPQTAVSQSQGPSRSQRPGVPSSTGGA